MDQIKLLKSFLGSPFYHTANKTNPFTPNSTFTASPFICLLFYSVTLQLDNFGRVHFEMNALKFIPLLLTFFYQKMIKYACFLKNYFWNKVR